MKYLFTLFTFFIAFNSNAQTDKNLEAFAKEYFKHFQKKDFDWIMLHYATFYEIHGDYKNNGNKNWSEKDLMANYSQMRQTYLKSLNDAFKANKMLPKSKLVDVTIEECRRSSTEKIVSLIIEDTKGRQHFINPGKYFKTKRGHWTFFGNKVYNYYLADLNQTNQQSKAGIIRVLGDLDTDLAAPVPENKITYKPQRNPNKYIYKQVEQKASFPGGKSRMSDFIRQHLIYPEIAITNGISGIVYIEFVVNKDGSIYGPKIAREIGGGCGDEALRVVKKMPKWEPAKNNGQIVRSRNYVPFRFER